MVAKRKASSDVQLDEEVSRKDELSKEHYTGEHYLDNTGFLIMGESGGNDLMFVATGFRVGGKAWGVDDAFVKQTSFVVAPKGQRGRIQDNDFIGSRTDPIRPFDDFQVLREPDRVVWKAGNQQYISHPPYWEAKGEHMGLEFDITMGGLGKASRFLGTWADLSKNGRAGFEQPCWAEGTIVAKGNKYTLENGFAVHERVLIGDDWIRGDKLRKTSRHYWIWCLSEPMQIFTYYKQATGVMFGRVDVGGQDITFGQNEIAVDDLEWWDDPRTGMKVPIRWHINMNSAGGVVDMNVAAGARFIYTYCMPEGYITYYGFLCRTNGRLFQPGGSSVPIQDMLTYVECGLFTMPLGIG